MVLSASLPIWLSSWANSVGPVVGVNAIDDSQPGTNVGPAV